MSRSLTSLRRLLIVVGGLVAGRGLTIAAISLFKNPEGIAPEIGIVLAIAGFFAWRALVSWALKNFDTT